jgi:hypothetical protein
MTVPGGNDRSLRKLRKRSLLKDPSTSLRCKIWSRVTAASDETVVIRGLARFSHHLATIVVWLTHENTWPLIKVGVTFFSGRSF